MTINVGGHRPHPQNGTLKHKGPQPRLYSHHGGSHLQTGKIKEAPRLPQINDKNYAQQRATRRK